MRIEVDLDLCDRQFVCAGLAPSVFGIGAVGELIVLQPEPAEALRNECEEAAAACPMAAITVHE